MKAMGSREFARNCARVFFFSSGIETNAGGEGGGRGGDEEEVDWSVGPS